MKNQKIILVVEDDLALLEAFKLKLGREENMRIISATSGEEALAVLENQTPDLIALDILLPKMNGIQMLRVIRKDPRLKSIPVVVISVSGNNKIIKEARALGILDFLVKSDYRIDELVKKIKEYMHD